MNITAKIVSGGPSSHGTQIILEDGSEIKGLTRVTFTAAVGDINRIDAEIVSAAIEANGQISFYVEHPKEGGMREVSKIEFADGSEWRAS